MSRNRRDLTDEEHALWRFVTRQVTHFHGRATPRHPQTEDVRQEDISEPAPPSAPPQRRPAPAPASALTLGNVAAMDRRTAQRFARGELAIDRRLDLHGMTLAEAQASLTTFIRTAAARGDRCLLIITGKGSAGAENAQRGRIRSEAPHWLSHPSLRPQILAVTEARRHHGGAGALYVLLKRIRG